MSGFKEVSFCPNYAVRAGEEAKQWLTAVNDHLRTQGVTVDVVKGLFANRHVLNIPDGIQKGVDSTLSSYYGLTCSTTNGLGKLHHTMDLAAAVDYERFGVDPFLAIQEYRGTNWREALSPYAEYQPRALDMRFEVFANASKTSVVAKKGNDFTAEAFRKSQKIRDMLPEEWERYRAGIRWTQSGHAYDVLQESLSMGEKIMATTRHVDGLYFVKKAMWEEMLKYFMSFRSSQLLEENSRLREISPVDFMLGEVYLSTGMLLLPKGQKDS